MSRLRVSGVRLLIVMLSILHSSPLQPQSPPTINSDCTATPPTVEVQMNSSLSWDPPNNTYSIVFKSRTPFSSSASTPVPAAQPHKVKGDWACNVATVHLPSSLKICDFAYTPTKNASGVSCPDPIVRVIPPDSNQFYYWLAGLLILGSYGAFRIFSRKRTSSLK
jgi:hypothetical protein